MPDGKVLMVGGGRVGGPQKDEEGNWIQKIITWPRLIDPSDIENPFSCRVQSRDKKVCP